MKENIKITRSIYCDSIQFFKANKRLINILKMLIYHALHDLIPGLNIIGLSVLCVTD